jgi:hypothetical protein
VGVRFSAPVQTGPGAHPASCTMGTGSFPGVKSGRGVTLTPHHLLVTWSRKGRAIPLLLLWAVRPVQSLSACTSVHFTFYDVSFSRLNFTEPTSVWWQQHRNNNSSVKGLQHSGNHTCHLMYVNSYYTLKQARYFFSRFVLHVLQQTPIISPY